MKWWYLLFSLLLYTSSLHSQSVVQTFVDRCTGQTKIITIPFEGNTVVVFYNRSASFNINDVRSGALQAWLEETYAWWASISPCSTNQATTTATQATTQNTTQNATQNATSTASTSTNQTSSSTSQTNNTESSSSSTGEQTSDASGSNDSGNDGSGETSSSEEGNSDSGDETSSEESSEENSEGESEDDGEDSDDGEESEEEDEQSESKKSNPVIIAANVSTMSALDGSVNFVSNIGMSQASLNGVTSYSANAMIWDNLKQFNINIGKSSANKDQTVILYGGKKPIVKGGDLKSVNTTSINGMYSFGTFNISLGRSKVYMLPKQLIAGWAGSIMFMNSETMSVIPTGVGFITKPYLYNRYVISPMFAFATNPVIYTIETNSAITNTNLMFIGGVSGTFNLTKNFMANLGFNIIESTANLPMTWAITIGSRFQF